MDFPVQGLVSACDHCVLYIFSVRQIFLHQVVNPFSLGREIVSIVSGDLVASFYCFSCHACHLSVVIALVVDYLAVPVLGVVCELGSIEKFDEDVSVGIVEAAVEDIHKFLVVSNGIQLLFSVHSVGLNVIAFNWEGSIGIFPDPIDSSFGDVLEGKEAFSLDRAVSDFHFVKARHR